MTVIILFLVFAMSILSLVFFGGAAVLSIIAALIAAGLFVVQVFLFKESKIKERLMPAAAVLLLLFCLFIPSRATSYGYYDHLKLFGDYTKLVDGGKSEKAAKKLTELTEKYSEDDELRYMLALDQLNNGNVSGAEETAASFSNKHSVIYYLLMENVISEKYVSSNELSEQLLALFTEAADYYPEWSYAAKTAGGLLFEKGEYERACYYLTNAFSYSEKEDADICFYLGASLCEQGLYEKALPLFNEAIRIGVDEDKQAAIKWYLDKSGWEGSSDEDNAA